MRNSSLSRAVTLEADNIFARNTFFLDCPIGPKFTNLIFASTLVSAASQKSFSSGASLAETSAEMVSKSWANCTPQHDKSLEEK